MTSYRLYTYSAVAIGLIISVAAIFLGVNQENHNDNEAPIHPTPQASIVCDQNQIDLGQIYRPAPTINHDFTIKNITGEKMPILIASKSCQCTDAVLENNFIEPYGSTKLSITWEPPTKIGISEVSVVVATDEVSPSRILLSTRAAFRDTLRTRPSNKIDFGDIKPWEEASSTFTVSSWPGEVLSEKLDVEIENQDNSAQLEILDRNDVSATYRVTLNRLNDTKRIDFPVIIQTGHAEQPVIKLAVVGEYIDRFASIPGIITIPGNTAANNTSVKIVDRKVDNSHHAGESPIIEVLRTEVDHPEHISIQIVNNNDASSWPTLTFNHVKSHLEPLMGEARVFISQQEESINIPYVAMSSTLPGDG